MQITNIVNVIENASGALSRVVTALVDGKPIRVTQETLTKRMKICSACVHNRNSRCEICRCYLSLKQALTTEGCPKGYWKDT